MYLAEILRMTVDPFLCLLFSWGCKNDEDSDSMVRRLEQNFGPVVMPQFYCFSAQKFKNFWNLQNPPTLKVHNTWLLIGWKSGKSTYVPLWDRMEGAWLYRLGRIKEIMLATVTVFLHEWSHIKQQPRPRGLLLFILIPFPWMRA